LERILPTDQIGVFLETAHPAKFPEVIEPAIGRKVDVPLRLQAFMKGEAKSIAIKANLDELKRFLLK